MNSLSCPTLISSQEDRLLFEELAIRGIWPGLPETRRLLSFREFIEKVRPGYKWYKHCEVLCDVLQRVADRKIKRLMVFMPPRHSKSETIARLFSAYWLYLNPHEWVGINSYGAELAYGMSRNARDFYLAGGGHIRGDAGAVKHWETGQGGGMWAAGVGGPITGKGWHLGIIDDPIKNAEESFSEVIRAKHEEWYASTFYTREEPTSETDPDGALIVVQTRWNEADLSGWLLSQEQDEDEDDRERWHIVNFEAIKEEEPPNFPDTCTVEPDWREPGEALCPERRPIAKLLKIAKRIGQYFFSCLYQQRPQSRDGAMFQKQWFTVVDAYPAKLTLIRYWDKAGAAPGKGDWTVGVLMGRCHDGYFWIVDVERGQWPANERNKVILETTQNDKTRYGKVKSWFEQAPGLAKEATEAIIRMLAGFDVEANPVNKDKIERAEPMSAQCRAGNFRMIRAPWNQPYLSVMTSFPFGKHDDDVDASSGAFNKLADQSGKKIAPRTGAPRLAVAGYQAR